MNDAEAAFVLPTGTVTFLLTDVEGSSQLWETAPEAMADAIPRHYALLDEAVSSHGGVRPVEQGEGDSVVAAFSRASDAVAAALDAQLGLAAEPWPEGAPLRVRMAVHAGEAQLRDSGNYFGQAIIRCARVRDAGHGGQVLLSDSAAALMAERLPADCDMVDLGAHRLRDLGRSERLWQLSHPGLDADFPPLRSVEAFRQNLPVSLTPLIGRRSEIDEIGGLVGQERLVTLTGSGGVGKTRLALAVAGEVLERYPGGVWWIDLASLSQGASVGHAALAALGAAEAPGAAVGLADQVAAELGAQPTLMVLDNCEHVVESCAAFTAEVLAASPAVSVLATSREQLGVPGEVAWRVPSLAVPSPERLHRVPALTQFDAVLLFIDRARRARPSFVVNDDNAASVAQICHHLDGIPLAIELAAARCRQMSAQRIATELDDRFRLLVGGARTVMPRQQTLAASVAWSHDLLEDAERRVFRRLGVFAGTFPLEAGEAVVASQGDIPAEEVFDVVSRLVDKSLVVADAGTESRYRLLETLRAFALDQARTQDELAELRWAHARWMTEWLESVDAAEPTEEIVDAIDLYHDDLLAALECSSEDPSLGLRLLAQVGRPWQTLGRYGAALAAADRFLFSTEHADQHPATWLAAARGLAVLYAQSGRFDDYFSLLDRLEETAERHGDDYTAVTARWLRGGLSLDDSFALQEVARADGQLWAEALTSIVIAEAAVESDPVAAHPLIEKATAIATRTRNSYHLDGALVAPAKMAICAGNLDDGISIGRQLLVARSSANQSAGIGLLAFGGLLAEDPDTVSRACEAGQRVRAKLVANSLPDMADHFREVLDGGATRTDPLLESSSDLNFRRYGHLVLWLLVRESIDAGAADEAVAVADRWITAWHPGSSDSLGPLPRAVRAAVAGAQTADAYHWHEALRLAADHDLALIAADALEGLAVAAADDEDWADCLRLLGAAERLRSETGYRWRFPFERRRVTAASTAARDELGSEADAAASEGASLDWRDAARYAQRSRGGRRRPRHGWDSLTPTELDVIALITEGLTNPQIAERLLVKRATVKSHLEHIYAKLGVQGRAQLAAEAGRRGPLS